MSLAESLDQIHHKLTRLWDDASTRPGVLTYSEYAYLRALERLDGAQVTKTEETLAPDQDDHHDDHLGHHLQNLADVLGVRKASASAAIAKLERRGFVERTSCRFDARAQHIMLTDTAKAHLHDEAAVYGAASARIEQLLSAGEFESLKSTLAKVRDHL